MTRPARAPGPARAPSRDGIVTRLRTRMTAWRGRTRIGHTGPGVGGDAALEPARDLMPRGRGGAALGVVVAGMCYLACLALGGALMTGHASRAWTDDLDRALTVQVVPRGGADVEAEVAAAVRTLEAQPAIARVDVLPAAEAAALIEPWLGDAGGLGDLPVPRLIHVALAEGAEFDLDLLAARLAAAAPNATLDTHGRWRDELAGAATAVELAGLAILALVAATTAAIVVFATRASLAANRETVDVLHLIGARDAFIAGEVQRHFLITGLKAGLGGWAAAALTFLAVTLLADGGAGMVSLLPQMRLPWPHYATLLAVPAAATLLTAAAARMTVMRALSDAL